MEALSVFLAWRAIQRAQWLDRAELRSLQERKLHRLINHAYQHVEFYRRRFDEAGITPDAICTLDDLKKIPVTTKADLQAEHVNAITSSKYPPKKLISESTTGSSGRPFTVRFDPHWVHVRKALFLRALMTAGYRPGRKLLLIVDRERNLPPPWLRWLYVSYNETPERMITQLNYFRPWMLYGWVTPLRQLAEYIRETGGVVHQPKVVVSTAESLDGATRCMLEKVYGAEVYEIYGLTEMGVVAWECPAHNGRHLAEDTSIVEFVPANNDDTVSHLIMTNLELSGTPFIRYDVGDLGVHGSTMPCRCGRTLARLDRVEGRLVDAVQLRDGRMISPYRFTLALEQIPGFERYQLIQEDFDSFTVRFEGDGIDDHGTITAAQQVIIDIVGSGARVRVRREESLDPPAGRKFRVVECRIPADANR